MGKENICEFHAKENGFLLGQGRVDFLEVHKAMGDVGYSGWVQIEGAVPKDADMFESYVCNNNYIRSILKV